MKITSVLFADAANATSDGKQNILGAGIRTVFSPEVPFVRPLQLYVAAEGDQSDIGSHPVRIDVQAPHSRSNLVATDVSLEVREGYDSRLPLGLSFRIDLGGYLIQEWGEHVIRIRVGRARAKYVFIVEQRPMGDIRLTEEPVERPAAEVTQRKGG